MRLLIGFNFFLSYSPSCTPKVEETLLLSLPFVSFISHCPTHRFTHSSLFCLHTNPDQLNCPHQMHFSACSVSLLAVDEHCQLNEAQLDQVKDNLILHQHPELKLSHVASFTLVSDEKRQTHSFYLSAIMMGPANVTMLARGNLLRQTPLKVSICSFL